MTNYTNNDGLLVEAGAQGTQYRGVHQETHNDGDINTLSISWSFDRLPRFDQDAGGGTTPDSFSARLAFIPANSLVTDVYTIITTAFAGGTSYVMGTYQRDGTVIDADGFYTGTELATAGMNTKGKILLPDGVDVRRTSGTFDDLVLHISQDAYVLVTATGTFTAGAARTVIQYIRGV